MRALVYENVQIVSLPSGIVGLVLRTPPIRPRLEGYAGALRGPALAAWLADRATVTFQVRPAAATAAAAGVILGFLEAIATFRTASVLEGDTDFAPTFPFPTFDVSGSLRLGGGHLSFDVDPWGTLDALQLSLTNRNPAAAATVEVITQIYGEVRVAGWEAEREWLGTP